MICFLSAGIFSTRPNNEYLKKKVMTLYPKYWLRFLNFDVNHLAFFFLQNYHQFQFEARHAIDRDNHRLLFMFEFIVYLFEACHAIRIRYNHRLLFMFAMVEVLSYKPLMLNVQHLRSTFAVRETASLGIMGAPRVPPLNPSESIVLSEHYRL